jgi:hypothetical protein
MQNDIIAGNYKSMRSIQRNTYLTQVMKKTSPNNVKTEEIMLQFNK